jgi:Na+/melibiose symporter-like transporter
MIEKLNLALAAGIALPFLSLLGYAPGAAQPAFGALSATYALLPCLIKLAAAGLLWRAPIDRAGVGPGTGASQNGVQT